MPAEPSAPSAGPARHKTLARVAAFVAVGIAAACMHWAAAVSLVAQAGWRPLQANAAGWVLALAVSFGGHRWLTHGDPGARMRYSIGRFFALSTVGFVVNQASYAWLIHAGVARYDWALAAILAAVAVLTFAANRAWVSVAARRKAGERD